MKSPKVKAKDKPARPLIAPDAESIARDGRRVCGDGKMLDRFAMEGGAIARYLKQLELTNFIDVGCWYGLLLRDVLTLTSLHSRADAIVAAVDAIPAILNFAKKETDAGLGSPRIKWIDGAVVPESLRESAPVVRVHAWDTSRSGVFANEGTVIPNVRKFTIRGLLEDVFDAHAASVLRQHLARTYLKIDAEGCDEGLVGDLLEQGLLPAVIHFEVAGREYAGRQIVRLLREAGYQTPRQFGAHSVYSLA